MSEFVAISGDEQHSEDSALLVADSNGTGGWSFVGFTTTLGTKIKVNDTFVITQIIANWSYVDGSTPGGPLPPVPDSATLNGSTTILLDDSTSIIRENDDQKGTFDNRVYVNVTQTLLKSE